MPRTHDVQALTDSQLLQFPKTALQQLVQQDPLWWQRFGQLLTVKLRLLFVELEDRALLPAQQRLARRLCQLSNDQQLQIPLQQEQLGQLLSLSRQTTNQLLRQLAEAGLLQTRYGTIELLNRPALVQLAQHGTLLS
jgi:CRP-like cAMP-binding protein